MDWMVAASSRASSDQEAQKKARVYLPLPIWSFQDTLYLSGRFIRDHYHISS